MSRINLASAFLFGFSLLVQPLMAQIPISNASFELGDDSPDNWTLTGGDGGWYTPAAAGDRAICVLGDGTSSNAWLSSPASLAANTVYRLRFQACRPAGNTGLAMTGPVFCNRDLSSVSETWNAYESFFVTPRDVQADQTRLRFGQWEVPGKVAFDDLHLNRVVPIYRRVEGLVLGDGESILGSHYTFDAPFGRQSANHARPLAWHNCSFNSNRWVFGNDNQEVVYRFEVGRRQRGGMVRVQIGWYRHGQLNVSASADGQQWKSIGTLDGTTSGEYPLPTNLFPADVMWVRLSAQPKTDDDRRIALQIHGCGYTAELEGQPVEIDGMTQFVTVNREDPALDVAIEDLGTAIPGADNRVVLRLRNLSDKTMNLQAATRVETLDDGGRKMDDLGTTEFSQPQQIVLPAGDARSKRIRLAYGPLTVGEQTLRIAITGDSGFAAEASLVVPALHAAHYGKLLPGSTDEVGLWTCSSGWKVSQRRPVPAEAGGAIRIEAASNEAEAAQLVVRPSQPLSNFQAQVADLRDAKNNCIPIICVDLLRVRYLHVTRPTDASGTRGFWPDPLPPLEQPMDLEPGRNYPLWVRVRVPKGTPGGLYRSVVQLRADGYRVDVPLQVQVFDFELPDRMSCQTAFGFSPSVAWNYHGVQDESQKRAVLDKYLKCLADHHISPYDPAPLDPVVLNWTNVARWSGGAYDDSVAHQGNFSLKVADDSKSENAAARYSDPIPVTDQPLKLSLWYRCAEPGHSFIVSLQHYDEQGRWMSGRNRDMLVQGDTEWREFEQRIQEFPAGTHTARLQLWAAEYREDGSTTGTVWYDDVALVNAVTGDDHVQQGSFESDTRLTPQPSFDFAAWDGAMRRAIDHYHFNTFRLGITGLGGGTFHRRYPPSLLGFGEETPQYQQAMRSYLQQLESHLREQGWLDEAFVYWFDEPDPKDYEFVLNGFGKLKRWAPDLRRMLTEQVEEGLIGGPNIWCPLTPAFDLELAEQRRKAGEEFWWYVCTGPKAPYCTLFIDHPGTEMRIWLWQTWKRKIRGILVWQTNYWTSSAAYPDPAHPQNPYEDPMGWVSGYSTEQGTRRPWGNGDGRFIYPPEAAADGRVSEPVLSAPVSSIRLEMLRDGLEDYEYLAVLERMLDAAQSDMPADELSRYQQLLLVPDSISADLTHFSQSPAPIETRRRSVARAIEQLSGK
jgi:hypothetical protein